MTETTTHDLTTGSEHSNSGVLTGESVRSETPKRKRNSANKYKGYEDAQRFAKELQLKSRKEWREYVKGLRPEMTNKPEDVPAHPDGIYKTKGWQGWRQWLGTEKPTTLN